MVPYGQRPIQLKDQPQSLVLHWQLIPNQYGSGLTPAGNGLCKSLFAGLNPNEAYLANREALSKGPTGEVTRFPWECLKRHVGKCVLRPGVEAHVKLLGPEVFVVFCFVSQHVRHWC